MSSTAVQRDTAAAPARSRPRYVAKRLAIAAAAVAVGLGAAWFGSDWWTTGRFVESTDDAYVGGNVTMVAPYVSGFVAHVLVADNEHVQAGQILIQLDRRDLQTAYDKAAAVVDARGAALTGLQAQYRLQQVSIQQAIADQAAKAARAAFTRDDGNRYAALALTAAGSRQDAEKTRAASQEADAELAGAQAGLEVARQRLPVLDARIAEARADLVQAQAGLRTASLNIGYTDIRAPIEGYVGNRAAQVGAYAAAGSYLLAVIPAHGLWVDANFKEDQLARMMPGQPASAVVDVAPGTALTGRVVSIAHGTGAVFSVIPPENATGNFTKIVQRVPVRIELDPADPLLARLRPGLSTTVSVNTKAGS